MIWYDMSGSVVDELCRDSSSADLVSYNSSYWVILPETQGRRNSTRVFFYCRYRILLKVGGFVDYFRISYYSRYRILLKIGETVL